MQSQDLRLLAQCLPNVPVNGLNAAGRPHMKSTSDATQPMYTVSLLRRPRVRGRFVVQMHLLHHKTGIDTCELVRIDVHNFDHDIRHGGLLVRHRIEEDCLDFAECTLFLCGLRITYALCVGNLERVSLSLAQRAGFPSYRLQRTPWKAYCWRSAIFLSFPTVSSPRAASITISPDASVSSSLRTEIPVVALASMEANAM